MASAAEERAAAIAAGLISPSLDDLRFPEDPGNFIDRTTIAAANSEQQPCAPDPASHVFFAMVLRQHISSILDFFEPVVRDEERGGFHNQLRDDGTVYEAETKHVVGTCRFTVNYALAARCFPERADHYRELCARGVAFLMGPQRDEAHGGFSWVAGGEAVADHRKYCYSVAFALLALSHAHTAGVAGSAEHLRYVLELAESKYFEPAHGLYIDSYPREMAAPDSYRGQNANMHMCEALLAVYEATGERAHLERAAKLAHKLTVQLPASCGTEWVVEHYSSSWVADPQKNADADPLSEEYIFRPPGYQPGHAVEWAKLLVLLERYTAALGAPERAKGGEAKEAEAARRAWMLPAAARLFGLAVQHGWDEAGGGGLIYLVGQRGEPIDRNKYYWALAEMIGAAGLLADRAAGPEPAGLQPAALYWN